MDWVGQAFSLPLESHFQAEAAALNRIGFAFASEEVDQNNGIGNANSTGYAACDLTKWPLIEPFSERADSIALFRRQRVSR